MKRWLFAVAAAVLASSAQADLGETRLNRDSTDRAGSRQGRGAYVREPSENQRPVVNPRNGQVYAPAGQGYVGSDGRYFAPAGPNAVVDTRTGQVIPIGR